jgi:hypothetical protein
MSQQLVFINCPIIDRFRSDVGKSHFIDEKDLSTTQLFSPRLNFMFNQKAILDLKRLDVIYVYHYNASETNHYANIYDFVFSCRPNATNRNRFFVGLIDERMSFSELLSKCHEYVPVSGNRMPLTVKSIQLEALMMQGCHLLQAYNERNFLSSEKRITNNYGILVERCVSKGNHVIISKAEGYLFSISTPIIGMLIDYYQIDSSYAGPNAQLNFSFDAEYRLKVASYLKDVLRAFCFNNKSDLIGVSLETPQEITRCVREIFA